MSPDIAKCPLGHKPALGENHSSGTSAPLGQGLRSVLFTVVFTPAHPPSPYPLHSPPPKDRAWNMGGAKCLPSTAERMECFLGPMQGGGYCGPISQVRGLRLRGWSLPQVRVWVGCGRNRTQVTVSLEPSMSRCQAQRGHGRRGPYEGGDD